MHNAIGNGMEYMTHPLSVLSIISFRNDIRCCTEAKGDVGNNNITLKQSNLLNSIWSLITLSRWLDKVITTRWKKRHAWGDFRYQWYNPLQTRKGGQISFCFFCYLRVPCMFAFAHGFLEVIWAQQKPIMTFHRTPRSWKLLQSFLYLQLLPQYWTTNQRKDNCSPFENAWHHCPYLALVTFCRNRQPKPLKRGLLPPKENTLQGPQGTNISPSNGPRRASAAWSSSKRWNKSRNQ